MTISQRELRNDNADVIRRVESGEELTVTRRGVPVARMVPLRSSSELPIVRAASSSGCFTALRRVASDVATSEVLLELRGER